MPELAEDLGGRQLIVGSEDLGRDRRGRLRWITHFTGVDDADEQDPGLEVFAHLDR